MTKLNQSNIAHFQKSFTVNAREHHTSGGNVMSLPSLASPCSVSHMAVAGVGLWVAMAQSSTIALYHTESFIHMQVGGSLGLK